MNLFEAIRVLNANGWDVSFGGLSGGRILVTLMRREDRSMYSFDFPENEAALIKALEENKRPKPV